MAMLPQLLVSVAVVLAAVVVKQNDLFRWAVLRNFNSFQSGTLCITFEDKRVERFGQNKSQSKCDASMILNDEEAFFKHVATVGGFLGLGEAYMYGWWSVPQTNTLKPIEIPQSAGLTKDSDIEEVFKYARYDINGGNSDSSDLTQTIYHITSNSMRIPWSPVKAVFKNMLQYAGHLAILQRMISFDKSRDSDKRDIAAHYDLNNNHFRSFLGPELSGYSCGHWNKTTLTVTDAQNNKWETIIRKIDLQKNERVLDVGCGWGYFCYKVAMAGGICHGITLSVEQLKFAQERYADLIKEGRITFSLTDYRDMALPKYQSVYDKIVSVGMIEHIGYRRIDEYFGSLTNAIKPGGLMLIHGITLNDWFPKNGALNPALNRRTSCSSATFNAVHIFPGGCLFRPDWYGESALKFGLRELHGESYRLHYAKTLKQWNENYHVNFNLNTLLNPQLKNDEFFRKYEFYLSSAESSFRVGFINLHQFVYLKPSDVPANANVGGKELSQWSSDFVERQSVINPNQN